MKIGRMDYIKNREDVQKNIQCFAENLTDSDRMIGILSKFSHWFYDEESGYFAPSKFIGYLDNNYDNYFAMYNAGMDGRDSDDVLKRFYKEANAEVSEKLYEKLVSFLSQYDKKPKKTAKIYISK